MKSDISLTPHGLTRRWIGCVALMWLFVPLLARVGLFDVAELPPDEPRPLLQLGSLALTLPAAAIAAGLGDQTEWLLRTSTRKRWGVRLRALALVLCPGVAFGMVILPLMPAAVPPQHTILLWLMAQSLALASIPVIGAANSGVIPVLFVIVASTPGALPWDINVVYNLNAQRLLATTAATLAVVSLGAYVVGGDATGRREHREAQ